MSERIQTVTPEAAELFELSRTAEDAMRLRGDAGREWSRLDAALDELARWAWLAAQHADAQWMPASDDTGD